MSDQGRRVWLDGSPVDASGDHEDFEDDEAIKTCHVLQRTSPFGEPFVGECMLCGQGDLTIADASKPCENLPRLTEEEALMAAIEGHLPTPPGGGS